MKAFIAFCASLWTINSYSQTSGAIEELKNINGTSIFVKTVGEGEPILFIHGGPGLSHGYFLPHVAPLSERASLIFYDQRACGRSAVDIKQEEMTLAHFSADISALLKELGIEKVHLLGHSFGGLIAMKFATENPGQVSSLILCNSVAASKEFDQLSASRQQEAMTARDNADRAAIFASEHLKNGSPEAYELLFKIGFKRSFFDTLKVEALEMNLNANFPKTSKLLYGLTPDLVAYDYHPALAKLQVPALIIHGAADLVPAEAGKKLAATLPHSQYVVFEQSGHFPFVEEPEKFTKTIADFVNDIAAKKND